MNTFTLQAIWPMPWNRTAQAAPTGRNITAWGKRGTSAAPGNAPTRIPSPDGAGQSLWQQTAIHYSYLPWDTTSKPSSAPSLFWKNISSIMPGLTSCRSIRDTHLFLSLTISLMKLGRTGRAESLKSTLPLWRTGSTESPFPARLLTLKPNTSEASASKALWFGTQDIKCSGQSMVLLPSTLPYGASKFVPRLRMNSTRLGSVGTATLKTGLKRPYQKPNTGSVENCIRAHVPPFQGFVSFSFPPGAALLRRLPQAAMFRPVGAA